MECIIGSKALTIWRVAIKKRTVARLRRRVKKSDNWLLAGAFVILVVAMTLSFNGSGSINTAAYAPLLDTIAKGESGGNYNAHFGNAKNSSIRFTDMTVAEVLQWQEEHVARGNVSSAVGKYQIIKPTLLELVGELDVDKDAKFDKTLQDKMAIRLLERRGAEEYANDKLTRKQFAANLAKEWAALPKIDGANPEESYYSADGINRSNITVDEIYSALDALKKTAKE